MKLMSQKDQKGIQLRLCMKHLNGLETLMMITLEKPGAHMRQLEILMLKTFIKQDDTSDTSAYTGFGWRCFSSGRNKTHSAHRIIRHSLHLFP